MEVEKIKVIFVVTRTSTYRVTSLGDDHASAVKIALAGESEAPVGYDISVGGMIAVFNRLIACHPRAMLDIESQLEKGGIPDKRTWHTTLIVAVFDNENEALACHALTDKKTWDPRWAETSRRVLEQINFDHPSIYISRNPLYAPAVLCEVRMGGLVTRA